MSVETKSEEEYDELVEEILTKMKENDLYVELKKCKYKVRKVGFLEVIMEPDRITMKKEKVKVVLEWPTSKDVKDVQKFLKLANYY